MENNMVYLVRCPFREIFRQNLIKKAKKNISEQILTGTVV
jgi:hypothetical protein